MLRQIATRIAQVGVIAASAAGLVVGVLHARDTTAPVAVSPAPVPRGCTGWTMVEMPKLTLIDVAALAPDDVWLLASRGVFHWDGCTWRAHEPYADIGNMIDWETIDVDPDGTLVITGNSPHGPMVSHGCVVEPRWPARRHSHRFARGEAGWEAITPRPRRAPDIDAPPKVHGERDLVLATSGDYAVIEREHQIGVPDADGVVRGWGTLHSTELWQQIATTWTPVLHWPVRIHDTHYARSGYVVDERLQGTPALPMQFWVNGVGGSGPNDLWVVGHTPDAMPEVMMSDGSTWTSHRDRLRWIQFRFLAVASTSPTDAWVVGANGVVMYWNGLLWAELEKPSFFDLVSVNVWPGFVEIVDAAGGRYVRSY